MLKNEEVWLPSVLTNPLKIFNHWIILDTGSTDKSKDIINTYNTEGKITLIEENYGNDANKIGNGRNVLREACKTKWMMLIDADEIYSLDMLNKLIQEEIPEDKIIMLGTCELQDVNGVMKIRQNDFVNRDRIFPEWVRWPKTDYPFESHYLENSIKAGKVHYIDARKIFAWHVRHSVRSSKNTEAYFREQKYNYFPYSGPFEDLPEGWIEEIDRRFPNPYLGV